MRSKPGYPAVILICLMVGTVSASTPAQPPSNGTYHSTDLGGNVFTGRISESWMTAPEGYGQVGNTLLGRSVNGPVMGTQWEYWCASVASQPQLVMDSRDSTGTGVTVWQMEYTGGRFWLAGDGPWGAAGLMDFSGVTENMNATTTCSHCDGSIVGVQSTYTLSGRFDPDNWYGSCVEFTIDDVTIEGSTDQEPRPDDYPPFMAADCEPSTTGYGAWGTASGIAIRIFDCVQTPVKDASWGEIKTLYRD
jgi:hypothetical protein